MSPQRCPFGGACHSCPPHIQAKLKIGQPGDKYEQEADRVAEQVMRMPEPQVQRKGCSSCEGKEDDEDKLIQAKPLAGQITPLPPSVQRKTEQEAEKDEDEDKILQAKSTGSTWNAHAHFGHPLIRDALSSPGSDQGKRLMAHELVHVGQQSSADILLQKKELIKSKSFPVEKKPIMAKSEVWSTPGKL